MKNEPEVEDVRFHGHDHLCRCHLKSGEATEAVKQCSEAIRIREDEEPRLFCDRAEAYLDDDMYDEVNSFASIDPHYRLVRIKCPVLLSTSQV